MVMMVAMSGLSLSPRPASSPLSSLCLANLPTRAAGRRANDCRSQQRRGRQPHQHAAAPAHALAGEVVGRLADSDLAILVFLNRDHAFALDLLVLDEFYQRIKVLVDRLGS
jgi:hypothetical protein